MGNSCASGSEGRFRELVGAGESWDHVKYGDIYRMRYLVPFRVYESKTTSGLTKKQEAFLNRYTEGTWSVNPTTGLVDIQGGFYFVNKGAKSFFGVKFGNVTGDFCCYGNKLQSLAGAPQKVDGGFYCYYNQLQSLEGAPQKVVGDFICSNNRLQSLKGAPQKVDGDFRCHSNLIQSLEGAPQKVDGDFSCSHNQLQSLEGAPQKVGGDFHCGANQLQSLEGAPQEVSGDFHCGANQLQSLAGAPQEVSGYFDCSRNKLQSLAGAPQEVGGDFDCYNNHLQSLEGAPKQINGKFKCDEFRLDPGEWNMEGWLEVLRTGKEEAKKLILTLPYLDSNFWNSKISQNPESTIIELSGFWDDMPDDFRNSIRIPPDLREDFDNLLDLVRAGIM